MKLPRKAKHWHQEILEALQQALHLAATETGAVNDEVRKNVYKYAPLFATRNRGLSDKSAREAVMRYCAQLRAYDFSVDDGAINNYGINFALSYLDAHVAMQTISEHKAEELMLAIMQITPGLPEIE